MSKIDLSGIDILAIMRRDGVELKQTATSHGGEFHGPCPFCPEHGKDRFTVWPNHEDGKGRFWCRKCETSGDVLDYVMLKRTMTRPEALAFLDAAPRPEPQKRFEPKNKPIKASSEWAESKWGKLVAEYCYTDALGKLAYTIQRREKWQDGKRIAKNFAPVLPDGVTFGLNGHRRYLYNLPMVVEARQTGGVVYLVEGEKCANALIAKAATATTSAGGSKGWSKYRDDYLDDLRGADVAILPDNDSEGRSYAETIAADLQGIAARVRVVTLPGLPPKGDVYDWLESGNRITDLHLLLRDTPDWSPQPQQPTGARWRILSTSELLTHPPITYLIPGEIPANSLTVMFGPSGAGKSFAALDYALQLASAGQPVIYMIGEGLGGYPDRLRAWCFHHHKTPPPCLYWIDNAVALMNTADVDAFTTAILSLHPALIIVDTLARAMLGGDENSAKDMGQMIASCQQIQRETGAAILLIHHMDKAGRGERGSSALRGAADSMIEVADEDGLMIISCSKSKDREPFPTRYVRRLPVDVGDDRKSIVLVASEKMVTSVGSLSPSEREILECLILETYAAAGAKARDIKEQTRLAHASVHRTLSRLMRRGYVRQAKQGDPYWIELAGKVALGIDVSPVSGDYQETEVI